MPTICLWAWSITTQRTIKRNSQSLGVFAIACRYTFYGHFRDLSPVSFTFFMSFSNVQATFSKCLHGLTYAVISKSDDTYVSSLPCVISFDDTGRRILKVKLHSWDCWKGWACLAPCCWDIRSAVCIGNYLYLFCPGVPVCKRVYLLFLS